MFCEEGRAGVLSISVKNPKPRERGLIQGHSMVRAGTASVSWKAFQNGMAPVFTWGRSPPSAICHWLDASALRAQVSGPALPVHQPAPFLEAEAKLPALRMVPGWHRPPLPQWLHPAKPAL